MFLVIPLGTCRRPRFRPSLAAAVMTVAGLAGGPINPLLNTVVFEAVPTALRGRVVGAIRAAAWASVPVGTILGGFWWRRSASQPCLPRSAAVTSP
jgi:MFS family permease